MIPCNIPLISGVKGLMRCAQKQFGYFCKSLSIFDWLSNRNPEIDTGLSVNVKMCCLWRPERPYFMPCFGHPSIGLEGNRWTRSTHDMSTRTHDMLLLGCSGQFFLSAEKNFLFFTKLVWLAFCKKIWIFFCNIIFFHKVMRKNVIVKSHFFWEVVTVFSLLFTFVHQFKQEIKCFL